VAGQAMAARAPALGNVSPLLQKEVAAAPIGRGRGNGRGELQVCASFLGVGAPEALMAGVVALVVFGPKGLAEAAKSLGKAARSLQPTIRELAEVSSDLKNTIEDELGLDEIRQEFRGMSAPTPSPRKTPLPEESTQGAKGTEAAGLQGIRDDIAKEVDPEIETKRAAAATAAWGGPPPLSTPQAEETTVAVKPDEAKDLGSMTIEELQAEIARRKAAEGAKEN